MGQTWSHEVHLEDRRTMRRLTRLSLGLSLLFGALILAWVLIASLHLGANNPGPSSSLPLLQTPGPGSSLATPAEVPGEVSLFFLTVNDAGGTELLPVADAQVPLGGSDGGIRAALEALLRGPDPGLGTTILSVIPTGTKLLDLQIQDNSVTISLSGELGTLRDPALIHQAAGQLVFTANPSLTSLTGVHLLVGGQPWPGGPISTLQRTAYDDLLPPIFLERPAFNGTLVLPGALEGSANVSAAGFQLDIFGSDGSLIASLPVKASCNSGCRGDFLTNILTTISGDGPVTISVYDHASDGVTITNLRSYPIHLAAAH
jgi:hypothetical protein